jgi:membrane fusion protein (multidrug efflux system)
MNCSVNVLSDNNSMQLTIPAKAVVEQMGEDFVFTVKNNTVFMRKVSIDRQLNGLAILNSGVQPGDLIVTEGTGRLKDGDAVIIK